MTLFILRAVIEFIYDFDRPRAEHRHIKTTGDSNDRVVDVASDGARRSMRSIRARARHEHAVTHTAGPHLSSRLGAVFRAPEPGRDWEVAEVIETGNSSIAQQALHHFAAFHGRQGVVDLLDGEFVGHEFGGLELALANPLAQRLLRFAFAPARRPLILERKMNRR